MYIIIFSLIITHELGHFICAKIWKYEAKEILIYPLGGISKFNIPISSNPVKELIILICGPLFQNIAYIVLYYLLNEKDLVFQLHIGILIFNLLPIYPLDGGKIINILLNHIFNYKCSYKISIYLGYLITIIILFTNTKLSINMIITYLLLITMIRKEEIKINFLYNKLLLERLLYNWNFKKHKMISNPNGFYRYKENYIKVENKIWREKQFLQKKYHNFEKNR